MALRLCRGSLALFAVECSVGRLTRLKVMNMVILVIAQLAAAASVATPHIHTTTTYAPQGVISPSRWMPALQAG